VGILHELAVGAQALAKGQGRNRSNYRILD